MGGCAAFGCPNRSEHGLCFKAFPKDPQRRALWAAHVRRKNWVPTNSSRLCEMHFAPCMWEVDRVDGKKKLKVDAVPTIFFFHNARKEIKLPAVRKPSETFKRMVHFEPCMWEVDEGTGKRKLKAGAVPSLSIIGLVLRAPRKVFAEHSYMKRNDVASRQCIPYLDTSETHMVDDVSATKEAGGSVSERSVTKADRSCGESNCVTRHRTLRTYFNKRKANASVQNVTLAGSSVSNKTQRYLLKASH